MKRRGKAVVGASRPWRNSNLSPTHCMILIFVFAFPCVVCSLRNVVLRCGPCDANLPFTSHIRWAYSADLGADVTGTIRRTEEGKFILMQLQKIVTIFFDLALLRVLFMLISSPNFPHFPRLRQKK